ncbi:HTTM domain-containing protein [Roseiconus nitratireducens]|uniref:HTTM domain-containing protein n=1 Tax=Roseiconus nitratireducens TaxID=2605748 RepID=UPI001375E466|nr:HTTM domain-containing protein [Roseiconus nitratireducens]
MRSTTERLTAAASDQVSLAPLALLRVVLGVTFFVWASSFLAEDRWRILFVDPAMLFKYAGFEWVRLWPGDGIWWHFQVTRLAASFFVLGFLTRLSALTLATSMAYVLLVERQLYNNHEYLLGCTAMLCVFLPCGRAYSIDRLRWGGRSAAASTTMPRWQWWLVRFQLGLPYVFGAIAKLDSDWLAGQPAGLFVDSRIDTPIIGPLFSLPISAIVMAWGGFLFDLLVVPGLYFRRTRPVAIAAALLFHLTNATIFQIGVFPWFMIATLFVFFPIESVVEWMARLRLVSADQPDLDQTTDTESAAALATDRSDLGRNNANKIRHTGVVSRAGQWLAIGYVAIQLLLPLRPWLLPGNPSWNERGQRFAWRMMLRHKQTLLWFKIETEADYLFVPGGLVMSPNQLQRAPRDPELIRQAANEIRRLAASFATERPRIYALALVSLNGRPARLMIDPDTDLAEARRGWFSDDWVSQDPGPLPPSAWRVPTDQWWQSVSMPDRFRPLASLRPSEAQAMFNRLGQSHRSDGSAASTPNRQK